MRDTGWFTSSYSNGGGACVEVRFRGGRIEIRDTKDREGPVLAVAAEDWAAFLGPTSRPPVRSGG